MIANSAGYRTMLETLVMDADGQLWFLGKLCHSTHSTWINGWLDNHVSRMYLFTFKVVLPGLSVFWPLCVRVLSLGTLESQCIGDQTLQVRELETAHPRN
jgi:hypothetical protein